MTTPTLYDTIGGAPRLRELVDRFYDIMQLETDFAGIHAMHPVPNDNSRDKLFMFLSGWMGGPDLYIEKYGHRACARATWATRSARKSATSGCTPWRRRPARSAWTTTCACA